MKIGIVTYHDGINHGGFMQCYALYNTVKKLGHNVKIINYKNFKHWLIEYKIFLYTKNPRIFISNVNKIIKFRKEQNKLEKTRFTFSHKKISKYEFDTIIIGSDEVWNYTNPAVSKDLIYFGQDLNCKNLITYAPSFGWINEDHVLPKSILNELKKIDSISVRDETSKKIIKNNLNIETDIVLDPTFLFDFSGLEINCQMKGFILIYSVGFSNDVVKYIIKFAKKQDKKLVSLSYHHSWCDYNIGNVGPFEWLGYFKNSSLVITNKFHGTVFSIKYKKQFVSFYEEASSNKVKSMLVQTKLIERYANSLEDLIFILNNKINYSEIEYNMNTKVDYSINKLKTYIGEDL